MFWQFQMPFFSRKHPDRTFRNIPHFLPHYWSRAAFFASFFSFVASFFRFITSKCCCKHPRRLQDFKDITHALPSMEFVLFWLEEHTFSGLFAHNSSLKILGWFCPLHSHFLGDNDILSNFFYIYQRIGFHKKEHSKYIETTTENLEWFTEYISRNSWKIRFQLKMANVSFKKVFSRKLKVLKNQKPGR